VFGGIEAEQPRPLAAQHGAGGDHLGIEPRAPREQAMEEPAVPVGPLHHRGDRKAMVGHLARDLAQKARPLKSPQLFRPERVFAWPRPVYTARPGADRKPAAK
jgi:hypothetical protein